MTSASSDRTFTVRHVQLARAAFAALAALMITFSPDHSALVGMAVFSGFAIATGIVLLLAVWLVYPAGRRWPAAALGGVTLLAGMVSGLGPVRTITGFFGVVIAWALVSGAIELIAGWRGLRGPRARREIAPGIADARADIDPGPRADNRDAVVVGAFGVLLGIALLLVPTGFAVQYTIDEAQQTFTLTGIIIGVGIFGAYAAILAVYLGIAGFSPRKDAPVTTEAPASAPADQKDPA
ncbi:acyl-CoA synthetase [Microbacterium sp. CFBP9034]|uniref:acyl-CoA synthetase n=1 Tax=Microbacterium sp. CFBP9034 TaxID=3096540 RepID=UPI002A6B6ED1|nr:acyl-CoA synthetase [Microbacterium sp. CFBP9034]MDY0908142.1 acyl-CoA synthetase [Microbacterium sp. CFBP9034]